MVDFLRHTDRILNVAVDKFGEDVTFYPKATPMTAYPGRGIFDNEHRYIDPDTQQMISTNQPSLGINLNDFPIEFRQGDQVEIRGIRFVLGDKREDGLGGVEFPLNKVRVSDRIPDSRTT